MKAKETFIVNEKWKVHLRNAACGIVFALLVVGVMGAAVAVGISNLQNEIYTISIYDDGTLTEIRTTSLSVANALEIAEIELGENDIINVEPEESLSPDNTDIYIQRAKKVTLVVGDEEKEVYTQSDSVAEFLAEQELQVNTYDYLNMLAERPLVNDGLEIVFKKAVPITLNIDGEESLVYSTKDTIGEVLEENGYVVNDADLVNQKASDLIALNNTAIMIVTSHPVTLKYDGVSKTVDTQSKTVGDLLTEYGVKLSGMDRLANGVTVNTKIKDNLVVSVIRVVEKKVTETVTIPYKTSTVKTDSILKGFTQAAKKGSNGTRVDTYTVVTENGVEVSKTLTSSVVTKEAVDSITYVGTKTYTTFSSSFKLNHKYTKVLDVTAVAYNLEGMTNRKPGDKYYGMTANGSKVRAGIIAVDKDVIPVGTKVYVEIVNGNDYGYAIAADVGVDGLCIDLYLNSEKECVNFGRKKAKVYILADQSVDIYALRGG